MGGGEAESRLSYLTGGQSMSHSIEPAAPPLLYSQVETDERGNFEYGGDLQRASLDLPELTVAIQRHLEVNVAGGRFSVRGERFAGGRKVIVELIDLPDDLSDDAARRSFETVARDQVERFGFVRSNVLRDFMTCSFFSEVRIGRSYWSALSARRGVQNPVNSAVSLAAFKRTVKVGDQLKLTAAPDGHRSLGTTRSIIKVRSADLVLEGPSYLTLPKSSAFACDGERIRIGIGSDREPDAHLLYEWIRAAA
jgi:hypothetical protein